MYLYSLKQITMYNKSNHCLSYAFDFPVFDKIRCLSGFQHFTTKNMKTTHHKLAIQTFVQLRKNFSNINSLASLP